MWGKWGVNGRLVIVSVLLIGTVGPTALGAAVADSGSPGTMALATADLEDGSTPADADAVQRDPPDENNTTVVHQNPDEIDDEDSLDDMQLLLAREMSGQLAESVNLSQEDRERARELIENDSEYAELAEQYQEVQNQRQGSDADDGNDPLRAGQLQRQFFAEVELYRQIHEEYQEAHENDETLRTRRLAHELERRITTVNRTADRLNESYVNVSTMEEAELRNATRAIGEIRSNVTRTQMTVWNQTLVRTQLSVRANDSDGSFTDPVTLVGRLQTADGEPVATENVTLLVGNRTLNTTTDERGQFETEYRPTLAGAGERPRTVEFRPANESVYLRDDATTEFTVRQVEPNLTVSNRSATVRYNETLVINGTVTADGVGVPDVPLAVAVDGVQIAQVRTDGSSSFGAAGRVPANVSTGNQQVTVSLALENATSRANGPVALVPSNESAPVTVEEMATSLSIADVQTFNETAFVTGRLTTENGEPIPNRTVELRIDGRSVGETNTNGTGGYATTVTVPRQLLSDDSTVEVVAAYSPSEGNLAPTQANVTAAVGSSTMTISDRQLRLGAVGLLGLAVVSVFVWRFRSDESALTDQEPNETDNRESESPDVQGHSTRTLFDSARTALDDGESDAAVVAAYATVRRRLEDGDGRGREVVEPVTPKTHWEFYVACRDDSVPDERLRQLERLTEIYERAAFAAESVSEADAREAVELAEAFRPEGEPPEGTESTGERPRRENPEGQQSSGLDDQQSSGLDDSPAAR